MKATVTEEFKKKELKFPRLMESDGLIVLFEKETIGTTVHCSKGEWKIGIHQGGWNMDSFRDFNGAVTLEN